MQRSSDHSRDARQMLADLTQRLAVLQQRVRKHFPAKDRGQLESAVIGFGAAIEELRAMQADVEASRNEADFQRRRYQELFQSAPDGYVVTDVHGLIREVNETAVRMFQIGPPFLAGKPIVVFVESDDQGDLLRAIDDLNRGNENVHGVLRIGGHGRQKIIVQFRAAPEVVCDGSIEGIRWALRDITKQVSAQEELAGSRKQLRALAAALSQAEQRERRRIAAGIHDDAIQGLALAKMTLTSVRGQLNSPQAGAITRTVDVLSKVMADLRSLIFDLSPPVLYELGLGPAAEWLADQFSRRHRLPIELRNDLKPNEIGIELRVPLFQAIRELLINVVRHAKATRVIVTLRHTRRGVRIHVMDNGRGMTAPFASADRPGFGLFNVSNRIELMGGSFRIRSRARGGTCAKLALPAESGGNGGQGES